MLYDFLALGYQDGSINAMVANRQTKWSTERKSTRTNLWTTHHRHTTTPIRQSTLSKVDFILIAYEKSKMSDNVSPINFFLTHADRYFILKKKVSFPIEVIY